ncbi:MAG: NADH-quinone oxidoreductase subunit M, partial [Asgard group archaeon]|nr:NADH-quinone oxidoreductase subunit M [Asgard group archaeon]
PIVVFLLGKWNDKAAKWSAFAFTLAAAVFFALSLGDVLNTANHEHIFAGWDWIKFTIASKDVTIGFSLVADNLSFPIAAIIFILSLAAIMYSFGYMKKEEKQGAYYALLVLYIAGMVGVVLAGDLIQFYVFWELMLIPSYFIIAKWGSKPNAVKIAFKYFIFTHVGAMAILIGIGGLWVYGGSFNIATLIAGGITAGSSIIRMLTILLMLGFSVKMAIFPIHTWLPDTHGEAPTPISAILSGVMIETAAYAILRICQDIIGEPGMGGWMRWVLIGFAVFTMLYGGLMALAQKDTKRLFAFSSISQMGYIFFGLGTFTLFGATGSMFHIVSHALAKGSLFMVAGILMTQIGHKKGRDIKQLGGLGLKMPITAIVALIAALSLAGLPPLAGFMSEWIIFGGGLELSSLGPTSAALGIVAMIFAILSTALTATYVLLFMKNVFLGPPKEEFKEVKDPSPYMWVPLVILAILSFVIGILPKSVLVFITDAVKAALGGS